MYSYSTDVSPSLGIPSVMIIQSSDNTSESQTTIPSGGGGGGGRGGGGGNNHSTYKKSTTCPKIILTYQGETCIVSDEQITCTGDTFAQSDYTGSLI